MSILLGIAITLVVNEAGCNIYQSLYVGGIVILFATIHRILSEVL